MPPEPAKEPDASPAKLPPTDRPVPHRTGTPTAVGSQHPEVLCELII